MWTKRFRVCWLHLHTDRGRSFHITLPISFYALTELIDCAIDLLDIVCIFVPKSYAPSSYSLSVHGSRDLLRGVIRLLDTLTGTEPYDLVNVEVEHIKISIKFR